MFCVTCACTCTCLINAVFVFQPGAQGHPGMQHPGTPTSTHLPRHPFPMQRFICHIHVHVACLWALDMTYVFREFAVTSSRGNIDCCVHRELKANRGCFCGELLFLPIALLYSYAYQKQPCPSIAPPISNPEMTAMCGQ